MTNILTIASIKGIFVVGVAKLLILDEPSSTLSAAETQKVLTYIESSKEKGLPVIFNTHSVNHIYHVSDSYTIIRQGEKVGT